MSDERLRELERRFKESGSAEDECKYLLHAIRVGHLERARVELAAWVGHPAAMLLPRPHTSATQLLLEGLHEANCLLRTEAHPRDLVERVREALDNYPGAGVRDWVVRNRERKVSLRLSHELGISLEWPGPPPLSTCLLCQRGLSIKDWVGNLRRWGREATLRAAHALGSLASSFKAPKGWGVDEGQLDRQLSLLRASILDPEVELGPDRIAWLPRARSGRMAFNGSRSLGSEEPARQWIAAALVPWALERSDPLREQP